MGHDRDRKLTLTAEQAAPVPVVDVRGIGRFLGVAPLAAFVGAVIAVGFAILSDGLAVQVVLSVAAVLMAVAAAGLSVVAMRSRDRAEAIDGAARLIASADERPVYMTDAQGQIVFRNAAATARMTGRPPINLHDALADLCANPRKLIADLQGRARSFGTASEDVVSRRSHQRVTVNWLDTAVVWRIEDVAGRAGQARSGAISLPMLTAGPSGTILYMNEAFRRLVGARERTLQAVFPDLPLVSGNVHAVEGVDGLVRTLVAQVPCSGGRSEIYLLPPSSIDAVRVAEATGAFSSVRTDASALIRTTPATWDEIESLPVPLLKLSHDGIVLSANASARALLPMEVTSGTRLSDLLEGLGRPVIDWLGDAAAGRGAGKSEFLRGTGAHQDTFVQVSLSGVGAGARSLIAVLQDATELKSLEAKFVQSQKMQAIGQLAGGVAHDFNNLLTAISGHCDLLLLRHDQGDPDYGDLIQVHQNANRAASLVGQLLAFSRKQNLMPEVIDLRDTLSELTHLLNRLVGEKVRLSLNHDPLLLNIRADKRQLEQVLMNLVVNARDAMPKGGEIKVETENVTLREPLERDRVKVPAGDYIVLRVVDEGTGIPPEKLPKIFEPFYTTKRPGEGTGLGLSTAYGIVKQTGGFIFADSTVDVGSTFSLYFPAHDQPATVTAEAPRMSSEILSETADGVVLLVEDEAPVRAFASRALRLKGYSVLEADSAEAALELLADPGVKVDIFVTDVIMPGKDGPTWVREALRDRPDTKVVFVSGYAEDAFSEHKALIPNSVFLPKPFSLNDLTSTVQRQLH